MPNHETPKPLKGGKGNRRSKKRSYKKRRGGENVLDQLRAKQLGGSRRHKKRSTKRH